MLTYTPVKTYRVEEICNVCHRGNMIYQPPGTLSEIRFEHKCNKCDFIEYFDKRYPYIVHRAAGETELDD
jgi:hypothetical protein